MAVEAVPNMDALVFRDRRLTWRWYDAIGPGVVKYLNEFLEFPQTGGVPTAWLATVTGDSTSTRLTDEAGGALLAITDATSGDGVNLQLGNAAGECVKLDGAYPLYLGCRLKVSDADQTVFFFGLGVTDTDWNGGLTDGIYFTSPDESAALSFVIEKDSAESTTGAGTLVDDTYIVIEMVFDGTTAYAYVDGEIAASWLASKTNFPDDEELRLTIEFKTGETAANTCTIDWVRLIHLRGD